MSFVTFATHTNETDFTKTGNNRTGASLNAKFFVIQIVVFSDLMLQTYKIPLMFILFHQKKNVFLCKMPLANLIAI